MPQSSAIPTGPRTRTHQTSASSTASNPRGFSISILTPPEKDLLALAEQTKKWESTIHLVDRDNKKSVQRQISLAKQKIETIVQKLAMHNYDMEKVDWILAERKAKAVEASKK